MSSRDGGRALGGLLLVLVALAGMGLVPAASSTMAPDPAFHPDAGANITVTMTRQFTFTPSAIQVEPNQTVNLTLVNAHSSIHSFTLFAQANVTDAPLDSPTGMYAYNDTHAKIIDVWLGPGQTVNVSFTTPAAVGRYLFVCMYSSHWLTMNGYLLVGAEPIPAPQNVPLVPAIMAGTVAFTLLFAGGYHLRAVRAARRAK